jgi:hypothetical protein
MADSKKPVVGSIAWRDLTVKDAEKIRDFCSKVVGWKASPVDMGGYNDFNMNLPGSGEAVAGICHARGPNAKLPPQWLIYIAVAEVDESAKLCVEFSGKIIDGPKPMGEYRCCVIQDPAGAVAALMSRE